MKSVDSRLSRNDGAGKANTRLEYRLLRDIPPGRFMGYYLGAGNISWHKLDFKV